MICKMKIRSYILSISIFALFSCNNSKGIIENAPFTSMTSISHIQPDTCLTDKQLRLYFNFVKDSMKIENKAQKQRDKNEIDSLKIELKKHKSDNTVIKYEIKFDTKRFSDSITTIRKMYADSLKVAKTQIKQENKTERVEIRQENKTERARYNRWVLVVIAFILGFFARFIWQLVKVLYL